MLCIISKNIFAIQLEYGYCYICKIMMFKVVGNCDITQIYY